MRTRWLSNWVSPVIHGNSKVGLGRHWQESSSYSKRESFWHFPAGPKETAIPVACAAAFIWFCPSSLIHSRASFPLSGQLISTLSVLTNFHSFSVSMLSFRFWHICICNHGNCQRSRVPALCTQPLLAFHKVGSSLVPCAAAKGFTDIGLFILQF